MEQSTEESTGSKADIKILNDYCLLHIFKYLTVEEKLVAEEVCKRWKQLSRKSWIQYQFTNVLLDHYCCNFPHDLFKDDPKTRKIVSRLARYITSIDLCRPFPQDMRPNMNFQFICNVLQDSDKINTIFLTFPFTRTERQTKEVTKRLMHYAPQLKKFGYFSQTNLLEDEMLNSLLSEMKNLKVFYLDSVTDDTFLRCLPIDTLEELILENCAFIEINGMLDVLKKFPKLHTFCSGGLLADDLLKFPAISSIKNFGVCMTFQANNPQWSLAVSNMKNLEKLNVELNDNIDNDFIRNVTKYCEQLTYLNFTCCAKVTDEGTRYLNKLSKLKHLLFGNSDCITGKYLRRINQLEVLDCRDCPMMTDEALREVVKLSDDLRILNVLGCKLISNSLVKTAICSTSQRTNGLVLFMSISGTSIRQKEIETRTPLLRLGNFIHFKVDCTSSYNGYFPELRDYYFSERSRSRETFGKNFCPRSTILEM